MYFAFISHEEINLSLFEGISLNTDISAVLRQKTVSRLTVFCRSLSSWSPGCVLYPSGNLWSSHEFSLGIYDTQDGQ